MIMEMPKIVLRFRHPYGESKTPASPQLIDSMMRLAEVDELNPLIRAAEEREHNVSIELFRARNGRPLLIHFTTEER